MKFLAVLGLTAATLSSASPLQWRSTSYNGTTITTFSGNSTTVVSSATCNGQPYSSSKYTCYDDTYLCPIIDGTSTVNCGSACYDPTVYECSDGALKLVNGVKWTNGTASIPSSYRTPLTPIPTPTPVRRY